MAEMQVGVQLIIYGQRAQTDLAGVLAGVASAGYAGFEGGVPSSQAEADKVRAAAEKAGLAYAGGHGGLEDLRDLEGLKRRLPLVKALGGSFVISSGDSSLKTIDEYLDVARVLDAAGRVCRDAGLNLCYHNHHWEFRKIDGATPFYTMLAATDPDLVKLCTDVYWVHAGGEKPAEFIDCYRNRCLYFHFKDGTGGDGADDFRELGRGAVDLPAALGAARSCRPEWVIVEQDTTKLDPTESCRISRDYLKALGL